MVATITGFHSYEFSQTTDGVNDYYVGTDGTNGFSITPFTALANATFNVLINFPSTIDSTTAIRRILEIASSGRTDLYGNDLGDFTTTLTNEYIGLFTRLAGVVRSAGVTAALNIPAGWHMITISMNSAVIRVMVDGVSLSITNGSLGAPTNVTSGFTPVQMSIMGTSAGGALLACTWREAMILNTGWTAANALALYNYYTRKGNVSLANSNRSAWRFLVTPASRATILALWKGNESGTNLLDTKTSASNLTKTGF